MTGKLALLGQRRHPRRASFHAVLIRLDDDRQLEQFGKTQNISRGGCRFSTGTALGVGSHLQLLIAVKSITIHATARVVHENTRQLHNGVEVGVEFLTLTKDALSLLSRLTAQTWAETSQPVPTVH